MKKGALEFEEVAKLILIVFVLILVIILLYALRDKIIEAGGGLRI